MNILKNCKLVIIGGGILGTTIAREAAINKLFSEIFIIEKESVLGAHSSTRNSGVIHAGFYYYPESFKAKFCAEGNKIMREYCLKNSISINKCGKVVVSSSELEEKVLFELYKRGIANGSELQILDKTKLVKYETYAKTYQNFLWSPNTWSASPQDLFKSLIDECKELGIKFITNELIVKVNKNELISLKGNIYKYDHVINSAGGYSLEVAELFGIKKDFKILPFKGLYLKSVKKVESFQRHIYPVPDIQQPFLGIHTTLTSDNYLKLGPTAIPVFSPENYKLFEGLDWKISADIFKLQLNLFLKNKFGFRDLAFREIKYLIKNNILKEANKLTSLDLNKIDFNWHSPGIRPQLYNCKTQKLENDFILFKKEKSTHILNSISPAWTCSFKTAKYIIEEIKSQL